MIRTATQLKALIRNKSNGNSLKAQILIRAYIMERFLERISLSEYKNNFVLKGGMLISSMVGLDIRSTMDIDGTIQNMPLTIETARQTVENITAIPLEDNTVFSIISIGNIMEEAEYGGVRVNLEAQIDKMKTPLKIDISTGDVITPRKIEYRYKLMFEDRMIAVWAYNLETILAEKMDSIIRKGTANTRLRDFYDLYLLKNDDAQPIDKNTLKKAFHATIEKRAPGFLQKDRLDVLQDVSNSAAMQQLWKNYQTMYDYAKDISWDSLMGSVFALFSMVMDE
jgi:Domain of unknown function (DUF1814).